MTRPIGKYKIGIFDFFTPSEMLNNLQSIDSRTEILKLDIDNSDISDVFRQAFDIYYNEWKDFFDEVKDSTTKLSLNATRDKMYEFRNQIESWVRKYNQVSPGKKSLATVEERKWSPGKPGIWTWLIASVLGGLGLIVFTRERAKLTGAKAGLVRAKTGRPKSHKKGQY